MAPPYGCRPALVGVPTCCNGANPYHGTSVVSWGCPAPDDTKGIGRRNRRLYGLLPVRRRSCYGTTIARLRVSVLPFASPISQMTVYVVFAWVRIGTGTVTYPSTPTLACGWALPATFPFA